ncbi:MAG: hypothetical protein ACJ8R9_30795 [Steroidobacteraceae bacterium]
MQPQGNLETVTVNATREPCSGFAGDILDFTGGDSNQSFVDDVVDNFVDTKDSFGNTLFENGASIWGGGKFAATYYGTTPMRALGLAVAGYRSAVRIPGLLGSATPLQLAGTAAATWAINAVLIKGTYNAGVLIGSVLRTAANRAAAAACSRP